MAWIGRNLKDHLAPGHLLLDQVVQNSIQPGLENFHGCDIHHHHVHDLE